jgi:predicted RNA-binding protein with PIN domain
MVDRDDLRKRFDLVLRESAAVREASKELTREVERLRAQIEKHQAKERRKKPRVQGK